MKIYSTHVFKKETCEGGKRSQELVGASATGEKLLLLVIGRYAKPRCFKNAHLHIKNESNKKAWITATIFEKWIKQLEFDMEQRNRKIVFLLDNCTARHTFIDGLRNITLFFLIEVGSNVYGKCRY